jgi:hypothetical protein
MRRIMLTVELALQLRDDVWLSPSMVNLTTSVPPTVPIDDWWSEYPRAPSPPPTEVLLRRPDGTTLTTPCTFGEAHINYGHTGGHWSASPPGYKPPWVVSCALSSIHVEEVPPGTEVWYDAPDGNSPAQAAGF